MNSRISTGDNRNLRANKQYDGSKGDSLQLDFFQCVEDGQYTSEQLVHGFKGTYIRNQDGVAIGFYSELDADDSQAYLPVSSRRPAYVLDAPQRLPQVIHDTMDVPTIDLYLMNNEKVFEFWYPVVFHVWDQGHRNVDGSRKYVPPVWTPKMKVAGALNGTAPAAVISSASIATRVSRDTLLNVLVAQGASVVGTTGPQLHNIVTNTLGLFTNPPSAVPVAVPNLQSFAQAMGGVDDFQFSLVSGILQDELDRPRPGTSESEPNSLLGDDWLECVKIVEDRFKEMQAEECMKPNEPQTAKSGEVAAGKIIAGKLLGGPQAGVHDHEEHKNTKQVLSSLDTSGHLAESLSHAHSEHAQTYKATDMIRTHESMASLAEGNCAPDASSPWADGADPEAFFTFGDES